MDELQRAQSSLSRALGRSRAGEDRELAQRVRELGEQLAHMLIGLLRLTRVHQPTNRAFDAPVAEFGKALQALVELLGSVHLVTVEDQVYVNDVRTRDDGARGGARELGPELRRHNVGGLSFHAPLTGDQIRALIGLVAGEGSTRRALADALEGAGLRAVELQGIYRFRASSGGELETRRDPGEAARRLLLLATDTWNDLGAGRALNPLPLRHAVMEALDAGIEAPAFWLLPADAPPHALHAVQVTAVALLLGKAARLPLGFLHDLGIAAMLHDTGYLSPGPYASQPGVGPHAYDGARLMLRQKGFSEAKLRRVRALLDHHADWDDPAGRPAAGAAVLRVAEDYVNGARLYAAKVSRAGVLGAMLAAAGRTYHPVLPQLLVNALGLHPPGTVVELDGGRLGRVACPARGRELWDRPLVALLDPRTRAPSGQYVDLARGGQVQRVFAG